MGKVFFFCLAGVLLVSVSAMAQNKVVVVPMGSGAKGTNGQVQYNDDGRTAGAEVYYDKITGKLELPGELRTVDAAGNNRLWGKGRTGTSLLTHTDPNGYCTTTEGINHALSEHLETWGNAADVCPVGTWVCSLADLPAYGGGGECPIVPLLTFSSADCLSVLNPSSPAQQTYLFGWVSNKEDPELDGPFGISQAPLRVSASWNSASLIGSCNMFRAWCCWE